METTKTKQLEKVLHELLKYLHESNPDLVDVADYFNNLAEWLDGVHTDSSNPDDPPPPPPGHH